MNNLISWFTKKRILTVSFLLGGLSLYLGYISTNNQCFLEYKQCEYIAYAFIIFVPLFLLSILFYFTRESTFFSWKKFLIWWIPLSILLIILAPYSPADLSPIYKKTIFMVMGLGLIFVSITLIFYKSIKNE